MLQLLPPWISRPLGRLELLNLNLVSRSWLLLPWISRPLGRLELGNGIVDGLDPQLVALGL